MEGPVKKIEIDVPESRVRSDLEKYERKALAMGATKVKVISAADIPVDERVTLKCQIPRCFGYGNGANCPPNTMKPAELRDLLGKYKHAILFAKEVAPEVIIRDKTTIKERVDAYQDVYKIVNQLESDAFYDGHYFAFGFGAGSCRHTFCGLAADCAAMKGEKCRFSLRARPSMEAVGIDVFRMIATAGWEVYPIGSDAKAGDIPFGLLAGVVIVR